MRRFPAILGILAVVGLVGCSDSRRDATRLPGHALCPVNGHDFRIDSATMGGLRLHYPIDSLRALCPAARVDTVGVGGTQPLALSVDAPGLTVSAVQTAHEAYGDSLRFHEPADLWVAVGDSLRFADGRLIARTVGTLRSVDSSGVIVIDHGDDGTGSYVVLCRYPALRLVVDNTWPASADTGMVSFRSIRTSDTTRFWRVEVTTHEIDQRVLTACFAAPVT